MIFAHANYSQYIFYNFVNLLLNFDLNVLITRFLISLNPFFHCLYGEETSKLLQMYY
jgi:hypothetical protein